MGSMVPDAIVIITEASNSWISVDLRTSLSVPSISVSKYQFHWVALRAVHCWVSSDIHVCKSRLLHDCSDVNQKSCEKKLPIFYLSFWPYVKRKKRRTKTTFAFVWWSARDSIGEIREMFSFAFAEKVPTRKNILAPWFVSGLNRRWFREPS